MALFPEQPARVDEGEHAAAEHVDAAGGLLDEHALPDEKLDCPLARLAVQEPPRFQSPEVRLAQVRMGGDDLDQARVHRAALADGGRGHQ
jgi:hypothetical protein